MSIPGTLSPNSEMRTAWLMLGGAFATPEEVAAVADDLETWSRLVFDFLELTPAGPRSP